MTHQVCSKLVVLVVETGKGFLTKCVSVFRQMPGTWVMFFSMSLLKNGDTMIFDTNNL